MRVPLYWLKDYVKLPKDMGDLTRRLTLAGHMLDKTEAINNHTVIDLELRGNRADCYSIFGIAREVSSLYDTPVKPYMLYGKSKKVSGLNSVSLTIKTPLVKRVMMAVIKHAKITSSPKWLKERLEEYGIGSINNIVDLTNFVAIETGQPMHAFDLDKIGNSVQIRLAKKGEGLTTFQGNRLTLTNDDLVWAKGNKVLSVAGAIGGRDDSISGGTKNILVEAANYDRANIRRTVHRHNLFTDAGIRHEKDLDPNLVQDGVLRFLRLIEENKWGKIEPRVFDYYPKPVKSWKLTFDYDYLTSLGGLAIKPTKVDGILESLSFKVIKKATHSLEVLVPTYRTDVKLEEDLVEEVLRIEGYDKIPEQILSLAIPPVITPAFITQELEIKGQMYSLGFNEVISLPFVAQERVSENVALMAPPGFPIRVQNRPSPDFEFMRMSLLPNLLDATEKIINERGGQARQYEIGKIYLKKGKGYLEKRRLGIIGWSAKGASFAIFKGYIMALFEKLLLPAPEFKSVDLPGGLLTRTYSVVCGKSEIGIGGEAGGAFCAEIDLDSILGKTGSTSVGLQAKYPPQIEDLTLHLPTRTLVGNIQASIEKSDPYVRHVELVDIYEDAYTFRIWYQDPEKTLTDAEVEEIRAKIIKTLKEKFGAVIG